MKRILHIFLLICLFTTAKAQPYGNEWVVTGRPYYKFKIAKTSLYRITYTTLTSIGISSAQLRGTSFKLIRNGQEVPLYVSTNGVFGPSDFIEFYGEKNDGKPDSVLYRNPADQPTRHRSLYNDTAAFFLSIAPFDINARMIDQANDISSPPPPEKFCYYTISTFGNSLSRGIPVAEGYKDLYNSDFDMGEGYQYGNMAGLTNILPPIASPYTETPENFYHTIGLLQMYGPHRLHVIADGLDTTEVSVGPVVRDITHVIKSTNTNVGFSEQFPGAVNYVNYVMLEYPRLLSFDNQTKFSFGFHKTNEIYYEIKNFNVAGTVPILYDLKNKLRYTAVVDTAVKFHMEPTALEKDKLYLSSQSVSDIPFVTNFTTVNFTNFLNSSTVQGNYLIISNKKLKNSLSGIDYIEQYRQYRLSAAGGSYNAKTYFIDELTDQFAYGIPGHPLAIRNFVNFAIDKFSVKPELVYLIGKGFEYNEKFKKPSLVDLDYLPTYGEPASDNLLTARSGALNFPQLGIGRLAASRGDDIRIYLDKVKEYESVLNDTFNVSETPFNKMWMKNVLHLGGGNNNFEQQLFRGYLDGYKNVIEMPYYGARVAGLFKNSTDPIQIAQNIFIDSLVNTGVSLITFFGHSSTSTLDFNLDPSHFDNKGKYHLMLSNGCFVGSIFVEFQSLSEQFVLTPNKAGIGYLAPVTFAVASNLNAYTTEFYKRFSRTMYNDKIGNILKETCKEVIVNSPPNSINPMAGEQMVFHGDPGLRINSHYRPDYYIDPTSIQFEPQNINASVDSFLVKVIVKNLGKAIDDNYIVNIDRIFPNGQIQVTKVTVPSARNIDTVLLWVRSDRINGPGLNTFKIKVDYGEAIPEYSELNNEVTVTKLILADDIIPIYPYEFCIVNDPNFELVFSTASAFAGTKPYIFQIDTTEAFNSPLLTQVKLTQPGATIHWKPNIPMIQNKVYYWRGTVDSSSGTPSNWKYSSFLYNTSLPTGWNQSHYFQYLKNSFSTLSLKNDRMFYYPNTTRSIQIRDGGRFDDDIYAFWDGYVIGRNAWRRSGFIFFVYDGNTGLNWQTYQIGNSGRGPYNDITLNRYPTNVIEFVTNDINNGKTERGYVIDFLNSIPCNAYVLGYSFFNAGYSQWAGDSVNPGDRNLFQAFENLGVTKIRQQPEEAPYGAPFAFFIHKCDPTFRPIQIARSTYTQVIDTFFTFSGSWTKGSMESPIIGPAKNWKDFSMEWHGRENPTRDEGTTNLYGYDTAGTRTLLRAGMVKTTATPLASIDPKRYPFVQLQWLTRDDTMGTPPQMDYWRITYDKAPEAVVNPTIHFVKTRDTIVSGENFNMSVAVENVTPIDMDSLLVRFIIRDASNDITTIYKRFAPLPGHQSQNIEFNFNFAGFNFFGLNAVTVEVNPNEDQPEQFHFNNFAEFSLFVDRDRINPLFDVTFDGRHITDGEYISSNPEILFRLKDENKYLALNDTSEFLIYMFYPNDPTNPVQIGRSQADVTFVPAQPNANLAKNNEARLIYKPTLTDGTYEIRAQGIDRSKNDAGRYDYRIKFRVDSKPSITNILNYPNPFSTSTQFVFTLTGATIPEQLIIQIFSATGKVVKEITRDQLGTLHVGTNVTDYKWDGTDNFGDRLANGVYFYRVMTKNMDGSRTEVKESSIDKYFKHGYGKLYIIR